MDNKHSVIRGACLVGNGIVPTDSSCVSLDPNGVSLDPNGSLKQDNPIVQKTLDLNAKAQERRRLLASFNQHNSYKHEKEKPVKWSESSRDITKDDKKDEPVKKNKQKVDSNSYSEQDILDTQKFNRLRETYRIF